MGVVTHPGIAQDLTVVDGEAKCETTMVLMSPSAGAFALAPPSGGLSGSATLINVVQGTEFGYAPVVLDNFSDQNLVPRGSMLQTADLNMATPKTSLVFHEGKAVSSTWPFGVDAVSAVLMHASLRNDFVLEPITQSGTDRVVSMPTRMYYYGSTGRPNPFGRTMSSGGVCEYKFTPSGAPLWGREGEPEGALAPDSPLLATSIRC
ncbi:MAG: hypothetical protein ABWY06_23120 [Pseudomonas sp.]|uniref:hypothetical protein n=1 Tax=Pseudomonas sp. TaxID=306 RepID=UPI0033965EFE